MPVRIITDSTVDIADKYSNLFTVVPLTVTFGEKDYIDGVTINKQEFYQKLVSSPELPKTSQATPVVFAEVFRKLQEEGDEARAFPAPIRALASPQRISRMSAS